MKDVKNLKLKIGLIVVVLVLMIVQISPFEIFGDEKELVFTYTQGEMIFKNTFYTTSNVSYFRGRVGNHVGYCLDIGIPLPVQSGGTLKLIDRKVSTFTTSVLYYGYPNRTAAQIGVNSDNEAELATQIAVWTVAKAGGDSVKTTQNFAFNDLVAKTGHEEAAERVKNAARRIVEQANASPYYPNPTFNILSSSAKLVIKDDYMMAGPYVLSIAGFNATTANVSLVNAPKSAVLCDANGNAKTTFANGESVYVKLAKSEAGSTLTIKAVANGSIKVAKIYGTGNDDARQDFIILKEDPISKEASVNFKWDTVKGKINLYKVDQYNNRIANVKFELKDSSNKVVATGTTDANGFIEFANLSLGEYTLTEVSAPAGYEKATEPYKVTVSNSAATPVSVTVKNRKIGKAKIEVLKYDRDDKSKVLSGALFNLLDSNDKVIYENQKTDANGKVVFDNLDAGTYKVLEVQAPKGYQGYNKTITVEAKENVVSKVEVPNLRVNGGIEILKVDENKKPVANVKFNILDSNKKLVETIVTDSNGKAETSVELKLGTYYYQEVEAPSYVVKNTEVNKFDVTAKAQVVTVTVENKLSKGKIKIVKKDEDGKVLAGVVFQILDSNKNVVDTITTDANGIAVSKELVSGDYTFKETSLGKNTGLVLDTAEKKFTLGNQTVTVDVTNYYGKGTLKILKTDSDGKSLEGVKFEIYASDKKTLVDTITTDKNGLATSKALRIGSYFYKEVSAPANVIMDNNLYGFSITKNNDVVTKAIKNELKRGKLQVVKTTEDGKPLANVTFQILDKDNKVVQKIRTNAQGIAESNDLPAGEYYYQEIEAPSNVVIDSQTHKFTMGYQIVKVEVKNNYAKGTIQIVKTDSNKNLLQGVKFEIYTSDMKTVVDTITTDAKGVATSKELVLGTYYCKEIEAPKTVIMNTQPIKAEITKNKQVVKLDVVNELVKAKLQIEKVTEDGLPLEGVTFQVLDANQKVVDTITTNKNGYALSKELPQGEYYYKETKVPSNIVLDSTLRKFTMGTEVVKVKVENKYAVGKIRIIKFDSNKNALSGVKFEIYAEDMKTLVDTITTVSDGTAVSKELKTGVYYYKEVEAPKTVVMNTAMEKFEIKTANQVVTVNVENKVATGILKIIKVSDEGEKLENVTFQILNANREVVDTIVTNKEGIATSKDLECGTYYYREDKNNVPVKVIPDTKEHEFTIDEQGKVVEVTVVNKVVKGSLKIVKTDDLKTPLEGVVFQILDSNKNVIEEITTDKEGIAVSKELKIGKYYYKEIKAPDNVIMDESLKEFTITAQKAIYEVNVQNTRICGKLIITKIDKDTKAPIPNVTFQILNENKEVINTVVTGNDGVARIGDLQKGKYYFKEVDAPQEYIMQSGEVAFEISRDVQTVEKTVVNEHRKLPQTGGFFSTNVLIVIIVAVVAISGYVILEVVKNKKNDGTKKE